VGWFSPETRALRRYLLVGLAWLGLHTAGLLGPIDESTFVVIALMALSGAIFGLRRYQVEAPLPWLMMIGAIIVWIVGGALRVSYETLGDLTADRSLVPDIFSLGGYVLMGSGLMILHHRRFRNRNHDIDAALDALITAMAVGAFLWLGIIGPALDADTEPIIEALLVAYPVLSFAMAALALRFAFAASERVPTHRLLLTSVFFLIVGDAIYMLEELSLTTIPLRVVDLPYGISMLVGGAAMLHPSVRFAADKAERGQHTIHPFRLVAVGAALAVPALISALAGTLTSRDRLIITVIAVALTAAGTWRVARAMNAQTRVQDRLSHAASHDSLTDLPNRAHLSEYLRNRQAAPDDRFVGALFADLDRFKLINDGMGHATGDALLRRVAARLQQNVAEADFVARVGGDEFVVVTSASSVVDIEDLAEQLRCALGVPFRVNGNEIHASLSIGVRIIEPGSVVGFETIIEDADSALYQAKKRGRNVVVKFDHSMREWADEQLFLEQELNNALTLGQLSVAYQPIVRLPDGALEGFEALARWEHPIMGAISPATFIPVAEETGMIVEIGAWILEESCRQLSQWRNDGLVGQVTMSVNLSPRQLHEPSLVNDIIETLGRHDVAHGALQLEITEGLLMSDARRAKVQLGELRDAGIRISLDDFGTGYSSMSQLKSFPVDSAKIDRSFVSGIGYNEPSSDDSLVSAIVAMSGALGLSTIAEGVENAAQADRLFELGVRSAQGYYFSRPVAADQMAETLRELRQFQLR
jgi:diguanylate cyclase (GGDEF)-like protein